MKTIRLFLVGLCLALAFVCEGQRVLTSDERQSLQGDSHFLEKCQWAIRDYSAYWTVHDGASLDNTQRAKWRREYTFVKAVNKAEYNDPSLALRFVILAKGMTLNVDADPTNEEIIALLVAGNKFEELASLYFDMVSQ